MRSRDLALALVLAAPVLVLDPAAPFDGPPRAAASVSILLSLDELVRESKHVVVATAGEHYSVWEDLAGARRIVTYTRLAVEQTVTGAPGGEVWVRTLGGVVGKLGQSVSGEAQLAEGSRALVFLTDDEGTLVVTGLAQGHFPIASDGGAPRLLPSPDAGKLLPRRGPAISAREVLVGAALDDAVETVRRARRAQDEKKK